MNQHAAATAATATVTAVATSSARRDLSGSSRNHRSALLTPRRPNAGRTPPPHRVHHARLAARLGLAAQIHDVHVEGVGRRLEVEAPDRLEDLLAGQHLPGVGQEHLQERELRTRQLHHPLAPRHLTGRQVHPQITEGEDVLVGLLAARRRGVRAAAQQRPDPGEQLVQLERLDQVVVRARVEPGDAVADRVARGEHQDGVVDPAPRSRMGGGEPVHPGHLDVEDDQIGPVRLRLGQRVQTVDGDLRPVPLEGQAALERLPHGGLVVDDQDALGVVLGGCGAHRSRVFLGVGSGGGRAWCGVPRVGRCPASHAVPAPAVRISCCCCCQRRCCRWCRRCRSGGRRGRP